jgi:hypothetical protein
MRLLLRGQCAISALLLLSSAAMADSIYPFLPPLPLGLAPDNVEYQTYGQVNGVADLFPWIWST